MLTIAREMSIVTEIASSFASFDVIGGGVGVGVGVGSTSNIQGRSRSPVMKTIKETTLVLCGLSTY